MEFIFRNYLAGSLYHKFYSKGLANPYGIVLPPELPVMTAFDQPLFTPTRKSEEDEPMDTAATLAEYPVTSATCLRAFTLIRDYMRTLGLELVDSKFEASGDVLGDEIVTPDSSRFCRLADIELGKEPPWLDKQIARDEAERSWGSGPKFPLRFSQEIIQKLSNTYLSIFFRITGQKLGDFQRSHLD